MTKLVSIPLSDHPKLDTKSVPDLADLTLAEIKHLVKADMGVHALMSAYMMRPQYFGMQIGDNNAGASSGYTYNHLLCLVPPMVSECYMQIFASASMTAEDAAVVVQAYTMAGATVGSSSQFSMVGEPEFDGDASSWDTVEKAYVGYLKNAQTYTSTGPVALRASPTWDPEPVHIRFEHTEGRCIFYGALVRYVYKNS